MLCDICKKDVTWINMVGKDYVCNKCIVKHTVLKEVNKSDESRLRAILRELNPKDFEEMKTYTNESLAQKKIILKKVKR